MTISINEAEARLQRSLADMRREVNATIAQPPAVDTFEERIRRTMKRLREILSLK